MDPFPGQALGEGSSSPLSTPPSSPETQGSLINDPFTPDTPSTLSDSFVEDVSPAPTLQAGTRGSKRAAAHRAEASLTLMFDDASSEVPESSPKRARTHVRRTSTTIPDDLNGNGELELETASKVASTDQAAAEPEVHPDPHCQVSAEGEETASGLATICRPEVWSNTRGGLCESLWYYRAYKGSLHTANKVALGFLIDAEADHLDVFDSQVIITSVGGGRVKDTRTKTMTRIEDAKNKSTSIQSLENAFEAKSLVAVIAGDGHPLYPIEAPHPYAILDFFHITYIWKEKQIPRGGNQDAGEVSVWRVRFEKANLNKPSWWKPGYVPNPAAVNTREQTCMKCNESSKEIFTVGWFCMNHKCYDYFIFPGQQKVDVKGLEYSSEFLQERTPFTEPIPSLTPQMPDGKELHGTEMASRRGFVCPLCGSCNRRIHWNFLVCENKKCTFVRQAPMKAYPKDALRSENEDCIKKCHARRLRHRPNHLHATILNSNHLRNSEVLSLGGFTVSMFYLPEKSGKIIGGFALLASTPGINSRPGGPDELFRELEAQDIGLRRNPAAVAGHKLEGLTRHFQQNFGARYKFGVAVQSKGFDEAPATILRALYRLIWAKQAVTSAARRYIGALNQDAFDDDLKEITESKNFNELLALGYMENDSINYHDDGESELGPVVAALSLGSPSLMRFRPKRKSEFVLPTQGPESKPVYKDVLEVPMMHGDMMVMFGTEVQRLYEHAVEPLGKRRFALTARYIDPAKMVVKADKKDADIKGAIPERARQFEYDGF